MTGLKLERSQSLQTWFEEGFLLVGNVLDD